jgi:hypothetical protein
MLTRARARLSPAPHSLKNADLFGKSDPVLYVEIRNGGCTEPWRSLGHTGARSGARGSRTHPLL